MIVDVELFHRTSRQMILTESGQRFREYAQEIVKLTTKSLSDIQQRSEEISGVIHIGGAETDSFRQIIQALKI